MAAETPYDWLAKVAGTNPNRACLMNDDTLLTYADILRLVDERATILSECTKSGEIIPIAATVSVESIVEILATQAVAAVPLPHSDRAPEIPMARVEDAAVLVATSGSRGHQRLVPLSYSNIAASVRGSRSRLGNTADDRWLLCLPLSHVGGLSVVWRSLEAGGAVVVSPFDRSEQAISRHRPTYASMVPTMVYRLLEDAPGVLASVDVILVGGAQLGMHLWHEALDQGVHLVPTYGLTEACSQVATLSPGDTRIAPGLVGRPLDGFTVTILNEEDEEVGVGETGRIAVEGSAVFSGFLGDSPRTKPYITNDLGRLNDDGDLQIEGRADDVIVCGGENVSLSRVADVIRGFKGVRDVSVVGLDDPHWGTIAGAMVVANRRIDVMDPMVLAVLKPHERPKRWIERGEIPVLENGKHDIDAVKAEFEEEPWI